MQLQNGIKNFVAESEKFQALEQQNVVAQILLEVYA